MTLNTEKTVAPLLKQKIGTLFLRDPHANRVKMTLYDIVSQLEVTLITPQKEWHFVCYFFFSLALTTVQLDTKLRLRFTHKVKC